jgi:hypothetical protein
MPGSTTQQVVVRVDRDDAGHPTRLRRVDLHDGPGSVVAADERCVQHAVQLHVVGVCGEAANQTRIFAALDALADHCGLDRHGYFPSRMTRAACWTAFTICW